MKFRAGRLGGAAAWIGGEAKRQALPSRDSLRYCCVQGYIFKPRFERCLNRSKCLYLCTYPWQHLTSGCIDWHCPVLYITATLWCPSPLVLCMSQNWYEGDPFVSICMYRTTPTSKKKKEKGYSRNLRPYNSASKKVPILRKYLCIRNVRVPEFAPIHISHITLNALAINALAIDIG